MLRFGAVPVLSCEMKKITQMKNMWYNRATTVGENASLTTRLGFAPSEIYRGLFGKNPYSSRVLEVRT